jgi:hypothetical protein
MIDHRRRRLGAAVRCASRRAPAAVLDLQLWAVGRVVLHVRESPSCVRAGEWTPPDSAFPEQRRASERESPGSRVPLGVATSLRKK